MSTQVTLPGSCSLNVCQAKTTWPTWIAVLSGALTILLGSAVLLGWAVHYAFLIQVSPNLPPMQRNTAASFVFVGLALVGTALAKPRLTFVTSAVTASLTAASLVEYLLHANFGIDELLGTGYVTTLTSDP